MSVAFGPFASRHSTLRDGGAMRDASSLTDTETLRARARRNVEDGAVTADYGADRETVLRLLNEALATEIVCWLRYKRHYFVAKGIHAEIAAEEFLEHAQQEAEHADLLAARIVQLRGAPDYSPAGLAARSHSEYVEGSSLREMIQENLVAERIAIDSYREIVRYLGDDDPTTRTLFERILAVEEEHADDLAGLLEKPVHGVSS
jgi:bacterioferritin